MDDLISRQAVIEINRSYHGQMPNEVNHRIWKEINELPSAQPETHEKRTETHSCDCISRQAAIEAFLTELTKRERKNLLHTWSTVEVKYFITKMLEQMPSAQPEIVRCGSCKYAEIADARDNQDGYTCQFHRGSIWFSGSYCSWAERRTDG